MKKVLIIGGSGFVGTKLTELKPEDVSLVVTFNTSAKNIADVVWEKCDLLNNVETKKLLNKIKPEIIINTSKVSPEAIELIVIYAKENNTRFIHLSSDAVFDGNKGDYTEQDLTHSITDYGKGKLVEEEIIKNKLHNYVIIRTSYVYGKSGGEWDKRTQNLLNTGKITAYSNIFRSPTLVDNLVDEIWKIVHSKYIGILHVVDSKMNMPNFFIMLAQNADMQIKIKEEKCTDNNTALDTSLVKSKY